MDDEYEISVSVPIPRDSDGFVRRQCPNCGLQFKWHDGPANEDAEHQPVPTTYSCPLCGQPAAVNSWNTAKQLELIQRMAMPLVMEQVQDDLEALFRGTGGLRYNRGDEEITLQPDPLTEPDDMVIVTSPCHGFEPMKVPEDHAGPLHCLVRGAAFAV